MGSFHLFVHPKWSKKNFRKMTFDPIFDPFFGPKMAHFQGILQVSKGQDASPQAQIRLKTLV